MKKNLLVIAKSLGGGGSEVALIEFLNHLDRSKYSPTLLLLDKDEEYKYRLKLPVNIQYIKFDNEFYHKLASMYSSSGKVIKKLNINKYTNVYKILAKHAEKVNKNYDIAVDFYGYGAFTTAYLALNVKANKKAFWLHDEKIPWIKNVENYFEAYNAIFCVSKAVKKKFDILYPKLSLKSKVFHNVIDINAVKRKALAFKPQEFSNNVFNIVTVGRLTEQTKGYDISIKAAKILKDKGMCFKWYIIGEGKDRKKIEKLIKQLKLENDYILLGRKNNPYPYIKNCNLYVQSSRHEGFGLSILEARILQKLIVVSDLDTFKEQIVNKKNGLVAALNPKDLSQKILTIYYNDDIRSDIFNNLKNENINIDSEIYKLDNL